MFETIIVSLIVGSLSFMAADSTGKYKGNEAIVKETGAKVCIIRDDLSYYLIRHENKDRESVLKGKVQVIDELCI